MTLPRMRSRMLSRPAAFVLTFLATATAGTAAPARPAWAATGAAVHSASRDEHRSALPPAKAASAMTVTRAAVADRTTSRAQTAAKQPSSSPPRLQQPSPSSSSATVESPQQAVIAARAREQQPESPKTQAVAAAGAFAGYAQARDALRTVLQRLPMQRNADTAAYQRALLDAVQRLQAQSLLAGLALDDAAATLQTKRLSPAATSLATTRRQALRDHLQRIDAAAQTLRSSVQAQAADAPIGAALVAEIDTLLATDAAADAPGIYGANPLPVHRPRLPARDPVMTPAIVPSYANADTEIEPQPADWAESGEAPLSPAILEQAERLGHDYTRILDFVRGNVRTRWYAGAQQGAEATLTSLTGNDVDQASLLIALLRASRAPARYVQGVVEVDLAALAASLSVRSDKVGLALAAAGIAHKPVVRGGRIAAYAIEHTYVSAYLPMANSRGSSADLRGRTWIALAPALKPATFIPARGARARRVPV